MLNKEKIAEKIGENIRIARENKKISQEKLAFKLELDRTYISMMERGKRMPSVMTLYALAKELKVDIREFLKI
jgi:transcriptional regulator with XRE-family HTH domain